LQSAIGKLAGTSDERLADALERLGELYTRWGRVSDAIPCYQKARVVWEKNPDKHAVALQANSVLLAHVKRYGPADPVSVPLFKTGSRTTRRGDNAPFSRLSPDMSSTPNEFRPPASTILPELPQSFLTYSPATSPSEPAPLPPQNVGAMSPELPIVYIPANLELQPLSADSWAEVPSVQTTQLPPNDGATPPQPPGVLVPVNLNLSSAVQSAFASAEQQTSAFVIGAGNHETHSPSAATELSYGASVSGTAPVSPSSDHQSRIEVSFINSSGSPISAAPGPSSEVPLHLTIVLPENGVHGGHTLLVPADSIDVDVKDTQLTGWDELSFDYLPAC